MKKYKFVSTFLALLLCAAMIIPYIPVQASAAALNNFDTDGDYAGLNLSVIGDSISTYFGVSNTKPYNPLYLSTSEATFGTYYGNTTHGDYSEFGHVKRLDTWWQQTADTLGMNLLVNNAWSGSLVLTDTAQSNTTEYGAAAYKARCVNLHNGSEKPDIIAVYLGTNDIAYYLELDVGTKADIDTASERSALYTSVNNYKTPTSSVEAYFIMLSRMIGTYPNAEIYCMLPTYCMNTMSTGRRGALEDFNGAVSYMVDYFAGQGKKVYLVDLNKDSGFVDVSSYRTQFYCNNVHPDKMGMDVITSCLVSEIMENSTKGRGNSKLHPVSYNLNKSFITTGNVRYAAEGKSLNLSISSLDSSQTVQVTALMTDAATGVQTRYTGSSSLYIPKVTGPIIISDSGISTTASNSFYHWQAASEGLVSVYGNGLSFNNPTLLSGTYSSGAMNATQYSLEKTVVLDYTKPWELEFRGGGTYAGGILLTSKTSDGAVDGNTYIHFNQSNAFFGYRNSVGYNNSGITWATIADKLGSSAGADIRSETHTYRFKNVPNGTNNKIWLYVDGVQIGTMDSSKMIGSSATHESVGSINLSGRNFEFNYLGSEAHPLQNFTMSYLKIWENGEANVDVKTSFDTYRWELSDSRNSFASVETDDSYTRNDLIPLSGSISGGTFMGTTFQLSQSAVLMHDQPWTIAWESEGSWQDSRGGGMMLATSADYVALSAPYIYRRPESGFIAFGAWNGSTHENYGIMLSDYGIDGTEKHSYKLVNEVSGNTNMVYLYVDDVKLGALNQKYLATTYDSVSNWISGKDFVFSYIGTTEFPVSSCTIPYLEIGITCDHSYGNWTTVTAATCTENGTRSRTCSLCQKADTEVILASGHTMNGKTVAANCREPAHTLNTCSACGHTEKVFESYTDWTTEKPAGVDESLIQTKQQYRYADRETITSYNATETGYTQVGGVWDAGTTGSVSYVDHWPSGFYTSSSAYQTYSASPKTPYETDNEKLVVNSNKLGGYLYYHWCYSGAVDSKPSKTGSYTTFHAYHSTTSPDDYRMDTSDTSYKTSNTSVCTNSNWYFVADVSVQTYTVYKKLFTHEKWGSWSVWSDDVCDATETRKVETQILYRAANGELGDHISVNGVCSICGTQTHSYSAVVTPPTCTEDGFTTYTCACGDSYISDTVPATGHTFMNGYCLNCGQPDPDYVEPVTPTITLKGTTLSLEDEILYNLYFTTSDMDVAPENMGMLVFDSMPIDATIYGGGQKVEGAIFSGNMYMVSTEGISGKNLSDTKYLVAYAKLDNGSYVYSSVLPYSAKSYCMDRLEKSTNANLKALCVAILNYGAAAQEYFAATSDYTYTTLMNDDLTADQKALVKAYSSDMMAARGTVTASKAGAFGTSANGFTGLGATMSADGIFSINYYFTTSTAVSNMTMYYWDAADFADASILTTVNATGKKAMVPSGKTNQFWADVDGIAAKDLDKTIYVCGVYTANGTTCTTGVIPYSLGYYCVTMAQSGSDVMKPMAAATAVYGYYAKVYFNA